MYHNVWKLSLIDGVGAVGGDILKITKVELPPPPPPPPPQPSPHIAPCDVISYAGIHHQFELVVSGQFFHSVPAIFYFWKE